MDKLEITNSQDRETVATILFKNNYTVKVIKAKTPNGRVKTYLGFEKNEEEK